MSSVRMPRVHVFTVRVRQGRVWIERRVKLFIHVMGLACDDGLAGIGVRREPPVGVEDILGKSDRRLNGLCGMFGNLLCPPGLLQTCS